MLKRTRGEYTAIIFIVFIVIIFALLTLLPVLNVAAKSLSSESAVVSGKVTFWPIGLQFETYKYVFTHGSFVSSLAISIVRTTAGTLFALLITVLTAYPLSKKDMMGRKIFLYLWLSVMLFRGGIIPNYMLYKSFKLTNTIFALILPQLVNVFNLLIVKNYMEGIPNCLDEAAKIDGASNWKILISIILPICLPVLATVALFYAVEYWNDYFFAMLYINKPGLKPLQQYLFDLVTQAVNVMDQGVQAQSVTADDAMNLSADSVRAAAIVAATIPILIVYPFLQRYFVKGIVIGSVKG